MSSIRFGCGPFINWNFLEFNWDSWSSLQTSAHALALDGRLYQFLITKSIITSSSIVGYLSWWFFFDICWLKDDSYSLYSFFPPSVMSFDFFLPFELFQMEKLEQVAFKTKQNRIKKCTILTIKLDWTNFHPC